MIVQEYALLRRAILDLWESEVGPSIALADLRSLEAAFDEAVTQSAKRYAQAREKRLRALDRVSEAALTSTNLDPFLDGLLRATLEGTESADTASSFFATATCCGFVPPSASSSVCKNAGVSAVFRMT